MILSSAVKAYICAEPIDMRKSIDGLAALVAPFEYVGMPMAIFWGVLVFGTWPDHTAWVGIALICGAGLYTLWRETVVRSRQ